MLTDNSHLFQVRAEFLYTLLQTRVFSAQLIPLEAQVVQHLLELRDLPTEVGPVVQLTQLVTQGITLGQRFLQERVKESKLVGEKGDRLLVSVVPIISENMEYK